MKVSKGRGGESANRLDWALEVACGLELQLVGHRVDLETVEPGPGQRSGDGSRVSLLPHLGANLSYKTPETSCLSWAAPWLGRARGKGR